MVYYVFYYSNRTHTYIPMVFLMGIHEFIYSNVAMYYFWGTLFLAISLRIIYYKKYKEPRQYKLSDLVYSNTIGGKK